MTESEWLERDEAGYLLNALLEHFPERLSERKSRLFACACCRRIWRLLPLGLAQQAVEMAERYADGKATRMRLNKAKTGFATVFENIPANDYVTFWATKAASPTITVGLGTDPDWRYGMAWEASWCAAAAAHADSKQKHRRRANEGPYQVALLHDIFGNPFRPVIVDPAWLTRQVVALAQEIYDNRSFDRLPNLADALEEAGCDNADILAHCRGPGPHVRGCWVVDLLLGKE